MRSERLSLGEADLSPQKFQEGAEEEGKNLQSRGEENRAKQARKDAVILISTGYKLPYPALL